MTAAEFLIDTLRGIPMLVIILYIGLPLAGVLKSSTGGFLDDLFVDPEARGSGAAAALIRAVADEGRARGWTVIRWITAEDNYRARGLYDRLAEKTRWATYDLRL